MSVISFDRKNEGFLYFSDGDDFRLLKIVKNIKVYDDGKSLSFVVENVTSSKKTINFISELLEYREPERNENLILQPAKHRVPFRFELSNTKMGQKGFCFNGSGIIKDYSFSLDEFSIIVGLWETRLYFL